MHQRRVPRLDVLEVEHERVLPVVGAGRGGGRRDGGGGAPRAVPAGVPDRARARLVPEHGRLRAESGAAGRRDQFAARLAV